jgi:esterase/lipase
MFWGGVQGGFSPFAMNPQDFAQDVNIPALVIYGTQDERVHRSEIDNIFHALPHASKQLVLMTESGHDDFMRTEPQKWKNAVADFLGAR